MVDADKAKSSNFIEEHKKGKEGKNLLGSPTFKELENGRLKCIETGHELLSKDKESYSHSKRCRLGLVDSALAHGKAPLNMFKQDSLCRSKLVCKLTGDVVNKSEEHIWKHINGRRFLNKLELKETKKLCGDDGVLAEEMEEEKKRVTTSKLIANGVNKEKKAVEEDNNCESNESEECKSDSEELEFWVPPVGSRWDFDDGGDRWASGTESGGSEDDNDDEMDGADEEIAAKSVELSMQYVYQAKRMSIEVGPSSFASRKKKRKSNSNDDQN